jgi:hypothetical protein
MMGASGNSFWPTGLYNPIHKSVTISRSFIIINIISINMKTRKLPMNNEGKT